MLQQCKYAYLFVLEETCPTEPELSSLPECVELIGGSLGVRLGVAGGLPAGGTAPQLGLKGDCAQPDGDGGTETNRLRRVFCRMIWATVTAGGRRADIGV